MVVVAKFERPARPACMLLKVSERSGSCSAAGCKSTQTKSSPNPRWR